MRLRALMHGPRWQQFTNADAATLFNSTDGSMFISACRLAFVGSGAHRHQSARRRCDTTGNAAVSGSVLTPSALTPCVLVEYTSSVLGYSRSSRTSTRSFICLCQLYCHRLGGTYSTPRLLRYHTVLWYVDAPVSCLTSERRNTNVYVRTKDSNRR